MVLSRKSGVLCIVVVIAVFFICGTQCIKRSEVLTRAKTWVTAKVPYSQTKYRGGYRTDCSSYVSMAWKLGTNKNTWTLGGITKSITKGQLAAGDILLKNDEHVVIFDKWANSAKTKYWGYEESSSKGAVHREIPYPYYYKKNKFLPRRYTKIQ